MTKEKAALLIIDMVKDNFVEKKKLSITPLAKKTIKPINNLIAEFRKRHFPIVFSTDSFHEKDFIFSERMPPHSITGTTGAEVIDELHRKPGDYWLPKPRFSAFFKTNLDQWLKKRKVTLCAVAGIATNICVLTTVLDALCYDFKAYFIEDCTASFSKGIHDQTLSLYRKGPLYPLLKVMTSQELIAELS
jgi:nicotinamidase/pyrazinamidase